MRVSRGGDDKTRVTNKNIDFYLSGFVALKDAASRERRNFTLIKIKIDPFIWINSSKLGIGKIFLSNGRLFINSIRDYHRLSLRTY